MTMRTGYRVAAASFCFFQHGCKAAFVAACQKLLLVPQGKAKLKRAVVFRVG